MGSTRGIHRLARALLRAFLRRGLNVPRFPADADNISVEKIEEYLKGLAGGNNLDDVDKWGIGGSASDGQPLHIKFKDTCSYYA